ncbi:MAG: glycoside hydrolase family 32 protein [Blautia sp.]|nr:glycoside hydrolase family 32 protein [Blautia sp.]
MSSQMLREARSYEGAYEGNVKEEERPSFHLTPRIGWMNDPNGFSRYQGKYHMFYQYYPYQPFWGPMHWGHAVSEDLLHWEYLPCALAPDLPYDKDGCFSGNAMELPDGRHLLMYTGVIKEPQSDGSSKEVQTQCIAIGDGVDYVKLPENPVITEKDLPEGSSRFDFRDPKLFKALDGSYRAIFGNRPADGSGQILMFESKDCLHWSFKKVLVKNENRFGLMWECPDFFPLDGKQVLLTSPQDMLPEDFEYHNGNGTLCLIGTYDEEREEFTEETNQAIDYGIDFYAPQTVLSPDGRRIMIGWMQNWDTCTFRTPHEKWYGQMSLPRELTIKEGRLYQWPIREVDEMRHNRLAFMNVSASGEVHLPGLSGRKVDLLLSIRPGDEEKIYQKFSVRFAQNDRFRTMVSLRPHEGVLKIDRKFSGSRRAIIHQRRSKIPSSMGGRIELRLVLDRYSVEVFVNGGEYVLSATFYTPLEADQISFLVDGTVEMDVVKYDL